MDLTKTCRLCFNEKSSLQPLYDNAVIPDLCSKIEDCVALEVSKDPVENPNQICDDCFKEIENWMRFKEKCSIANVQLKDYIENLHTHKDTTEEEEDYEYVDDHDTYDSDDKLLVNILLSDEEYILSCVEVEYAYDDTAAPLIKAKTNDGSVDMSDGDSISARKSGRKRRSAIKYIKAEPVAQTPTKYQPPANNRSKRHSVTIKTESKSKRRSVTKNVDDELLAQKRQKHRQLFNTKKRFYSRTNYYICDVCDKTFTKACELLTHDNVDHENLSRESRCNVCGKMFVSHNHVKIHKEKYHSEKKYECNTCQAKFAWKKTLVRHMVKHTGEFTCAYCGRTTASKTMLEAHIRIHTKMKDHVCEHCNKSFTARSTLSVHRKVHADMRLYRCDLCDYATKFNSGISIHMANKHSVVTMLEKCETCGKEFKSKHRLNEHRRRIHIRGKKFACDICSKKFTHNYELRDHIYKKHLHVEYLDVIELRDSVQ